MLGLRRRRVEAGERERDAEHQHEPDRLDRVGGADAERGDHQAAERRPDDRRDLVQAVAERQRGPEPVARERGDDGRARDVVDRRARRQQRGEGEDQHDRRVLGERDRRQRRRRDRDRQSARRTSAGAARSGPRPPRRAASRSRSGSARRSRAARRAPASASACRSETGSRPAPPATPGRENSSPMIEQPQVAVLAQDAQIHRDPPLHPQRSQAAGPARMGTGSSMARIDTPADPLTELAFERRALRVDGRRPPRGHRPLVRRPRPPLHAPDAAPPRRRPPPPPDRGPRPQALGRRHRRPLDRRLRLARRPRRA